MLLWGKPWLQNRMPLGIVCHLDPVLMLIWHHKNYNWHMFLHYILPHENINVPSEQQIFFNDLSIRQLCNVLFEAQSMLSKESSKSVPNFPSFLELWNTCCFLKGASVIYFLLGIDYYANAWYIGKATICRFIPWANISSYWNCTTKTPFSWQTCIPH